MAVPGQIVSSSEGGQMLLGLGSDGKAYPVAVDPATGHLITDTAVVLSAQDIEIGAVELKNGATDQRAVVDTHGSLQGTLADSAGAEVLGAVTANPTANTVLARLKDLLTGTILAAGSAIIGKVGIDQTTPGTTDLITKRYDRSVIVPVAFTQAASYAAGQSMGPTGVGNAKITLNMTAAFGVSMNNAKVKYRSLRSSATASTVVAVGSFFINIFPTAPAGTFTDAAVPNAGGTNIISAADAALLNTGITASGGTQNITAMPGAFLVGSGPFAQDVEITCDSTGKLYLVIQAAGTHTYTTPTGFNLGLEFTR